MSESNLAGAHRADPEARVVRYADLRPCLNAFIDTRTPGSEAKENFTVIGPGVSENPDQHVHIPEPHGFNIGGARQPPGCVNSQHSHTSAEVAVVHTGTWRFDLGEHGDDAQVTLGPGDVISIPTDMFRGFTNVGEETGYLFFVLGKDDPGRVTWAPQVFEMARDFGLKLMENGSLVDLTAGQSAPPGVAPMPPTTPEQAARMKRPTSAEAERLVVRAADLPAHGRAAVIGADAPLAWPHGFTLSRRVLSPGERIGPYSVDGPEVLFVQSGAVTIDWSDGAVELRAGDTATVPTGALRSLHTGAGATCYLVHGDPARPA